MFCSFICKFITEGRQEGRNLLFYFFIFLFFKPQLHAGLDVSTSSLSLFFVFFSLFFSFFFFFFFFFFFPPDIIYLFASMKLFASATKSASDSSEELNFQYPGPLLKLFM